MTSSELLNDMDTLPNKIEKALTLWDEDGNPIAGTEDSYSQFTSYEDMLDAYILQTSRNPIKFMNINEYISSSFLQPLSIVRSKLLDDEKLLEAVIFAKIFNNFAEFDSYRRQFKCDLAWVKGVYAPRPKDVVLIAHNKIIYHVSESDLDFVNIRQRAQQAWAVFKNKVKSNLMDTFATSDCSQDWNKYVSNLKSSFDIADFGNAPSISSSGFPTRHPMTEEVKKIMLEELNSLHLDARVKQQFVFDLKVLPDKDLLYWRDRLECLRFSSTNAASCAESQMLPGANLQQMTERIKVLEEVIEQVTQGDSSPTVESQLRLKAHSATKGMTANNKKSEAEMFINEEVLQQLVVTEDEEMKANCDRQQQLLEAISTLSDTVQRNEVHLAKVTEHLDGAAAKAELHHLSEIISDLKSSLDSTTCNPRNTRSFDENELSDILAAILQLRELIQCNVEGLPSIKKQMEKLKGQNNSMLRDKVDSLTYSVSLLQKDTKDSNDGIKLNKMYLEALLKKEHISAPQPQKSFWNFENYRN